MLPIAALDAGPRVARALGCGPIEGRDGWFGDVVLWDLTTLEVVGGVAFDGEDVLTVALHPTAPLAAVLVAERRFEGANEIRLVDLATGRVLDRVAGGAHGFAWNVAGDALAVRGEATSIYAVPRGEAPRLGDARRLDVGWTVDLDGIPALVGFAGRWAGFRGIAQDYRGSGSLPGNPETLATTSDRRWVGYAPGGATAVVADSEGRLHVYQRAGIRVVVGHVGVVNGLAFTPDSRHLAVRGSAGVTFATALGAVVHRVPDSAVVCAGGKGSEVWLVRRHEALLVDATDARVLNRRAAPARIRIDIGSSISSMDFFARGWGTGVGSRALAVGGNLVVATKAGPALWSDGGFEVVATAATEPWASRQRVRVVSSRDGMRWAALAWRDDLDGARGVDDSGALHAFTHRGAPLFGSRFEVGPSAAAFSRDGGVLALGSRARWILDAPPEVVGPALELRDATTGEVTLRRPCKASVDWLAYVDADTLLAIAGQELLVFDAHTLAVRQAIDLREPITAVDLAPGGSRLALARGHRVQIYTITR